MIPETGVLPESQRFYFEPDDFTAKNLFYVPHSGIYKCNQDYFIKRTFLDACQIIMVDSGSLKVEYRGETKIANAGAIVLLDCREPHKYYANSESLNIRWMHYVGSSSISYTDFLIEQNGFCFLNKLSEVDECFERILMTSNKKSPAPHVISVALHKLLALLSITTTKKKKSELEKLLEKTVQYMENNYGESSISINSLAESVSISSSYYMKKFKEVYDISAYQYLQNIRLRNSKEYLTTSRKSVEEIAEQCGFCSSSHFIMSFRKNTQMTPLEYRNSWR